MDPDALERVGADDTPKRRSRSDARRTVEAPEMMPDWMLAEYRAVGEEKRTFERSAVQAIGLMATGGVAVVAAAGVAKAPGPLALLPTILACGLLFVISLNLNVFGCRPTSPAWRRKC